VVDHWIYRISVIAAMLIGASNRNVPASSFQNFTVTIKMLKFCFETFQQVIFETRAFGICFLLFFVIIAKVI